MGIPAKIGENRLTCERVRQWKDKYRSGELSAEDRHLVERHCEDCPQCRELLFGQASEAPAEPPPYLASQIKSEARRRRPAERAVVRNRMVGSPQFLAACAVIVAGTIATLAVVYYFNSLKPREDAWAPAFVVTSGGGMIMLTDSEDPMRELSAEEMLERLHQGRSGTDQQGTDRTGESEDPAPSSSEAADEKPPPPAPPER